MFNKKLKKELQTAKMDLESTRKKLQESENFLSMFTSAKNAKNLIEEAKKECYSQSDINRLKLLEVSVSDINYRSFITKTKSGKVCIDIHQIPLTDKEISSLLLSKQSLCSDAVRVDGTNQSVASVTEEKS